MNPENDKQADYRVEKRWVREAFDRVAERYDDHAVLQHEVGTRMVERLDLIRLAPRRIVDVGAGTGQALTALGRRFKKARIIAVDLARSMLLQARRKRPLWGKWTHRYHYLCADAEQLPLADASVDLIFSNLTLQWCNDLDRAFAEFRRVLSPGGLLMFTTFGPDTLKELRASWQQVDGHTHVNLFMDMHDIGDALVRAQFVNPVMDVEHFTLTYPDILRLMRDLKQLGAHNVTAGRLRGLTGKDRFTAVERAYQRYRSDGLLPATYEVVYGHAWAPQSGQRQSGGGSVAIPVDRIRRRGGAPP